MTDSNVNLKAVKRWLHERVRRRLPRLLVYRMTEGPRLRLEFWLGDEAWRPSVHLDWRWRGVNRWAVLFL